MAGERIVVIGVGRIGAVTAVGLAHLLHEVVGFDVNEERVAQLRAGHLPEAEPGLRAALRSALRLRRLSFAAGVLEGEFDAAFLCVDTPGTESGSPDLRQLLAAAGVAGRVLAPGGVVVTRSTVPPGTGSRLEELLRHAGRGDVAVVHVPEFLREGRAWEDFREPDRLVVGANDPVAGMRVAAMFGEIRAPLFAVDRVTAELAKYAANAYLATSISFANEMADLSDAIGASRTALFDILRADRRIGREAYLVPGLGFGGHCLPKDTAALAAVGRALGCELGQVEASIRVNLGRTARAVRWLDQALGGLEGNVIAIAGLAFKPGTDDLRESPSLRLAGELAARGALVRGYDPLVREAEGVACCSRLAEALDGADGLVVAHRADWTASIHPAEAWARMRGRAVFDGPGVFDGREWATWGFVLNHRRGLHTAAGAPA